MKDSKLQLNGDYRAVVGVRVCLCVWMWACVHMSIHCSQKYIKNTHTRKARERNSHDEVVYSWMFFCLLYDIRFDSQSGYILISGVLFFSCSFQLLLLSMPLCVFISYTIHTYCTRSCHYIAILQTAIL